MAKCNALPINTAKEYFTPIRLVLKASFSHFVRPFFVDIDFASCRTLLFKFSEYGWMRSCVCGAWFVNKMVSNSWSRTDGTRPWYCRNGSHLDVNKCLEEVKSAIKKYEEPVKLVRNSKWPTMVWRDLAIFCNISKYISPA